jgi:DHA1 family bicyclomycin/chloramphenicol resistance-like MFS transporter
MAKTIHNSSEQDRRNHKQLPEKMIMLLIALLASFPALSTDLYLPALPSMSEQLNCPVPLVNLSLIVFFILISSSSIFWGPLSDKYGRKPILLTGVSMYIISSIFCMLSQTIYQLITARIFQAIGAGASMAVTLAIVKDVFPGKKRERTLAVVTVLNGMIPVVAPSIGAQIIRFTSWRGTFGALTIISLVVLLFILFLRETNTDYTDLSIPKTALRLFVVLKNVHFTRLLIAFSVISMPILGFIGVSSFIFIKRFGLSEQTFGIYFGSIAMLFVIGGPIYLFLQRYFKPLAIITASYLGSLCSGILMLAIGQMSPLLFAVSIACSYLAVSVSRPPSSSLLLEQQDKDTGSASSLIQASYMLTGSIGMMLISYEWSSRIMILGIMNIVLGSGGLLLWIYSKTRCRIPKHFI